MTECRMRHPLLLLKPLKTIHHSSVLQTVPCSMFLRLQKCKGFISVFLIEYKPKFYGWKGKKIDCSDNGKYIWKFHQSFGCSLIKIWKVVYKDFILIPLRITFFAHSISLIPSSTGDNIYKPLFQHVKVLVFFWSAIFIVIDLMKVWHYTQTSKLQIEVHIILFSHNVCLLEKLTFDCFMGIFEQGVFRHLCMCRNLNPPLQTDVI